MALMSDSWPVKVCLHIPSLTSHSLADASHAPDTNSRVSGARDRLITSPVCPAKVVVCWPVSMSHRALGRGRAGEWWLWQLINRLFTPASVHTVRYVNALFINFFYGIFVNAFIHSDFYFTGTRKINQWVQTKFSYGLVENSIINPTYG